MDLDSLRQQTLERTWDLHQRLYTIIEDSIESVRVELASKPYDPWYFSHSVRFHLCTALDSIPEEARTFDRVRHPLSGVELNYKEFRVKVWKVSGDEMPLAGNSPHRNAFLRQPYLPNYIETLDCGDTIPLNLFIGWDVDHDLHLNKVELVCPMDFDSPWKPGEDLFSVSIPHPALQIQSPVHFTEAADQDLEIELEKKKTGSDDADNDD
ncbi:MAG TPA: hypothetical protein VN736_24860 [Candidatus Limnocylindrales bacterium]|nr:hypothetical protein [Candidatus Limnocylindrales bacterium]